MNKKVLHTLIDVKADEVGNLPAIDGHGKTISYRMLKEYSNRIGHSLVGEDIEKGNVVGIYIPNSINYWSAALGVNKAGGIFMPLDPAYPVKRMQQLLDKVMPTTIITLATHLSEFLERIEGTPFAKKLTRVVVITDETSSIRIDDIGENGTKLRKEDFFPSSTVGVVVDGDDSNYLMYTSGSTGDPKVIEGCHKGLSHFIHWEVAEFGFSTNTRVSQLIPLYTDASLRDAFAPLLAGGTLCIPPDGIKSDAAKLLDWIEAAQINVIHTVPSVFRAVLREVEQNNALTPKLRSLKHFLLCGEALYGKDIAEWRAVAGTSTEIVNLYGPSETTLAKVFNRITEIPEDLHAIMPLGTPLPNTSVLIVNRHNVLSQIGEIGEIYIKTPFASKGYYAEAAMTSERFVQNPLHNEHADIVYRTGDLGKYLPDRRIAFVGRQDTQVKIRGNRVELSEIERVLLGYAGVEQVVVVPIKKAGSSDVLAAYFITSGPIEDRALRNYLRDVLPDFMHPSYVVCLEEFPLTLNGKIDKKALPKPEDILYEKTSYEAPRNGREQTLAAIWSSVLGLKKVGIQNSFFELGGHSLTATKVVSRIFKEIGVEISLKEFFENPTIAELSVLIASKQTSAYQNIPVLPSQPHYALSHAQKLLWVLDQTTVNLVAYHVPLYCLLDANVNKEAFRKAFDTLIARHESLRTTFFVVEGEPRQKIHEHTIFVIEEIDASKLETSEDILIERFADEAFQETFDLLNGPLLRCKLITLPSKRYIFLCTLHHIISDGWSIGVLLREILQLYTAYANGQENSLRPLRIHYKDYAAWHNAQLGATDMERHRHYWHQRLSGDLPLINLPIDYARDERKNYTGDKLVLTLEQETCEAIHEFCRQQDVTPFMFFLSVINVLLHSYSGQSDILIGSPISGRNDADLEDQIGTFLNILVHRNTLNKNESFLQFLQSVKTTVLDGYEHQAYPFDVLVEDLHAQRDDGRNPFYDVVVVLNNTGLAGGDRELRELEKTLGVKEVGVQNRSSKIDLTFFVETAEGIAITTEYSNLLFAPETIKRMNNDLECLVKTVVRDGHALISDLVWNLSDETEKQMKHSTLQALHEDF
ncbi:non-ribosomal peptide synthetase [Chryseolinea lacunae]|uniref:Amino acid adenylation domain-containing protein n=1 Tax=Chryseolinea lacunae TaxID=2801331 RepID=A0ABS1KUG4_9BACT|nr:non-ribosomal peptide synthetase [Chryseolinea lacunae]MBL0743085.1 amino acid adenylation domain-containing protein [Chryseolinea lacunae]